LDTGGNAAPQGWDDVLLQFFYLAGAVYDSGNNVGELFARPAPISPFKVGAYAVGATAKSGAGTFFGASGQYNGSANGWIMVFDAVSAPSTGTVPLYATAVGPASGPDVNWFISPGKPCKFATGLYVALSTTGGTFTASAVAALTGTVEYL
jgi:hypothetical protein